MKKNTSKRNFILLLFALLATFNYSVHWDNIWRYHPIAKDNPVWIPSQLNEVTTIRLADDNKEKISKKELKDEIKRRKKHHKALMAIYNENFEEHYLELIAQNSERLTNLRELLQS